MYVSAVQCSAVQYNTILLFELTNGGLTLETSA